MNADWTDEELLPIDNDDGDFALDSKRDLEWQDEYKKSVESRKALNKPLAIPILENKLNELHDTLTKQANKIAETLELCNKLLIELEEL